MAFGGGGQRTVYVPAPQSTDNSAAEAEKKRKKDKHALEQSYGQAMQASKTYMPVYDDADNTLSSSSLLNLSGKLGG